MDAGRSSRMICSIHTALSLLLTPPQDNQDAPDLMLGLPLWNSWIQLNTVFHEKQLSPYRWCIHDALLLWTVIWPTKNAQQHALALMYAHATYPPSCSGCHWLIIYLSDRTQPLRQAYICCHLLTKWYEGNWHLRLTYWLALVILHLGKEYV